MVTPRYRRYLIWLLWIIGFIVAFIAASLLTELTALVLGWSPHSTLDALMIRLLVYVVMSAMLVGLPHVLLKHHRHRKSLSTTQMGIGRAPTFRDIGLALAGAVLYVLLTLVTQYILQMIPGFDAAQSQDLGISTQLVGGELLVAYVVLVVMTPIFEEFIFRGILYGQLRARQMSPWLTAVSVSVLFGLAHGQWNVGVDVFCLSLVACYLREQTGTIWPGVVIHILKNGIAFWFIFIAARSVTG